jgi:hypothetical protein
VSPYFYARTHFNAKKIYIYIYIFAPVNRVVVITRRVVTYGIRAGSTCDLGFATAFVDRIRLIYCADRVDCVEVIMDRPRRGGRPRVLGEEA